MKLRTLINFAPICLLVLSLTFTMNSCTDPVKGCTDPDAETYNPDADESDDSQCVYARDKFIGNYKGSLICPGTLNGFINNAQYDFTITETAGGNINQVSVGITVFGAPTILAATVSGNTLTIDQTIPNVPIPFNGVTLTATIKATGTGTLGSDQKTLDGVINTQITATGLPGALTDNCPIKGTKQ